MLPVSKCRSSTQTQDNVIISSRTFPENSNEGRTLNILRIKR